MKFVESKVTEKNDKNVQKGKKLWIEHILYHFANGPGKTLLLAMTKFLNG